MNLQQQALTKIHEEMNLINKAVSKGDIVTLESFLKNKEKSIKTSKFDPKEESDYCIKALQAVSLNGNLLYVHDQEIGFIQEPTKVKRAIYKHYKDEKKSISHQKVDEIYKELIYAAPTKEEAKGNFIQFKNGILDMDTMTLKDKDPNIFIRFTIPHNYDPDAPKVDLVDKTFNEWGDNDEKKVNLMFAWIGYSMLVSSPLHVFLIIKGPTRNGKSVFCKLIIAIVGFENNSTLPLEELNGKFQIATCVNKLTNICTENRGGKILEPSILKAITSGDPIKIEEKGQPVYSSVCNTKCTFCFNTPFILDDLSGAVKERMLVLLFNTDFSDKSKQDPYLLEKLKDEKAIEYIIARSVKALKEVLDANSFDLPDDSIAFIKEQAKRDNNIVSFYDEVEQGCYLWLKGEKLFCDKKVFEDYSCEVVYQAYVSWCKENRVKGRIFEKQEFLDYLKEHKGFERKQARLKTEGGKPSYHLVPIK